MYYVYMHLYVSPVDSSMTTCLLNSLCMMDKYFHDIDAWGCSQCLVSCAWWWAACCGGIPLEIMLVDKYLEIQCINLCI